jgi:hypothetical protein
MAHRPLLIYSKPSELSTALQEATAADLAEALTRSRAAEGGARELEKQSATWRPGRVPRCRPAMRLRIWIETSVVSIIIIITRIPMLVRCSPDV